jgi:asparagine synthase (glutamine-hydrolysing)
MCGIAGTFGQANREVVERMVGTMQHRGPDDQGLFVDEAAKIVLGNCRLSVIDLSPAGHMPMRSADGQLCITHNGEVYNFRQLRSELERKGYIFQSDSDTEVVLMAYAEWGADCLKRLRGMFAFAIYDGRASETGRDSLFLARDRFGIKPLYWAQVNGVFVFASELKGVLASGLVGRQLDVQGVWDYLSFYSVPPPRTILAGVSALLPGHYMVVQGNCVRIEQYWDLPNPTDGDDSVASMALPDAARELRRLMEVSTRLHMVADVPVGAFLSGGIDSTAIVGLMSQHVSKPLRTYSIGFAGKEARISELPWAHIAAEQFGTDHTEVIVTGEDVAREFDLIVGAIDQPSGDGVNTYFVSKAARTGVTVSLSGLGGDELFAGYPQFRRFAQAERLLPSGNEWLSKGLRLVAPLLPGRLRLPAEFLAAVPLERYASVRRLYTEDEKWDLIAPGLLEDFVPQPSMDFYTRYVWPELDVVARVSYVEAKGYMAHTLLRDTDAMSMAHSLEVRVPFLDHKVAEFAFSLSGRLKLQGHETKVILRRALRDLLPQAILQRPKSGFELPMGEWLSGPLQPAVQQSLNTSVARTLFRPEGRLRLERLSRGPHAPVMRVWSAVVLMAWASLHGCEVSQ